MWKEGSCLHFQEGETGLTGGVGHRAADRALFPKTQKLIIHFSTNSGHKAHSLSQIFQGVLLRITVYRDCFLLKYSIMKTPKEGFCQPALVYFLSHPL